jgi:GNAT superfamily N-acetyltransferase
MPIRAMTSADIPAGLRLCRLAGWNQLAGDWALFLDLSADACFVAVDGDRVVGTAGAVRYDARLAWIGMMLVDPAVRGRGIGTGLLSAVLRAVERVPLVGLDATPAGKPLYRKFGFACWRRLVRLEATTINVMPAPANAVRTMTTADLASLVSSDTEVFGADRHALLEWSRAHAPEYALVAGEGQPSGYCFGRHGARFEHLGPIVAGSVETARELAAAAFRLRPGQPFVVDVPVEDAAWMRWLAGAGFREQRPFTRMLRGNIEGSGVVPPESGNALRQFAVFGPEFG